MAQVLGQLGSTRALVVHGNDGLDEITIGDTTQVWELNAGAVTSYQISPEDLGIERASRGALRAGSVEESARILRDVVSGAGGPARDIVLMNAGAALLAVGSAVSLRDGVSAAAESVDSGSARQKLEAFVALSTRLE
jgi:anthranilate phosphoribosyltransferase